MQARQNEILDLLLRKGEVGVTELSQYFKVSEVTIRKDLTVLERRGQLLRRYGGAVATENPRHVVSLFTKLKVMWEEKKRIAECLAESINDGENLLLDAGSTTLALARALRGRDLRIVTNSLAIAGEMLAGEMPSIELIGGSLRKASGAMVGPRTVRALAELRVDRVILGTSGFDPELGFSSENAIEAEAKHAMLACGLEKVIIADHSKFSRPAFANFAKAEDIDLLVTDRRLPTEISTRLKQAEVKIKSSSNGGKS